MSNFTIFNNPIRKTEDALPQARVGHTLTTLADGTLLLTGGAATENGTAQSTAYVVTDRRLFAVRRTATGNTTWSKSFHAIEDAVLRLRPDGTGYIIVRSKALADWTDEHASGLDRLRGVIEGRTTHELILKALSASRAGTTAEPMRDYLDLLIQGKRTLHEHRQV